MTMHNTQHDLSAGTVKLDYKVLIKVAADSFTQARDNLTSAINETYGIKPKINGVHMYNIEKYAKQMALAGLTYQVLLDGQSRKEKKIVNE